MFQIFNVSIYKLILCQRICLVFMCQEIYLLEKTPEELEKNSLIGNKLP